MSKELHFCCPDCSDEELNSIEIAEIETRVIKIRENGDFDYSLNVRHKQIDYGEVIRFECANCGFVIKDKYNEPITEYDEIVEWIKKNCK